MSQCENDHSDDELMALIEADPELVKNKLETARKWSEKLQANPMPCNEHKREMKRWSTRCTTLENYSKEHGECAFYNEKDAQETDGDLPVAAITDRIMQLAEEVQERSRAWHFMDEELNECIQIEIRRCRDRIQASWNAIQARQDTQEKQLSSVIQILRRIVSKTPIAAVCEHILAILADDWFQVAHGAWLSGPIRRHLGWDERAAA